MMLVSEGFVAVKLDGNRPSSIYMAEVTGEAEQENIHEEEKCGKVLCICTDGR